MDNQQNMEQQINQFESGKFNNPLPVEKQEKKSGKILKKGAKLVAGGLVFGLAAGVVFQGVNAGTNYFYSSNTAKETINKNISTATTVSNTNETTVTDVSGIVANAMPSIVSITSTVVYTSQYWFNQQSYESEGCGSGIIVGQNDSELLIVTNYHVVEDAEKLTVGFVDGSTVEAVVKGYDSSADVAVILVNLDDMEESTKDEISIAVLGSSDDLLVGEPAIAIGNALGYGQSVTVGYISALNREVSVSDNTLTLLQTDAAINPGNSGGALINMNGEVIGINAAKYTSSEVEGMGYAIPISDVITLINDLMNQEVIPESEQAYLGIVGSDITQELETRLNMPQGIYVAQIAENSPAERGSLSSGDIITAFDDRNISTMEELQQILSQRRAGDEAILTVKRQNKKGTYEEIQITVTLEAKENN